MSYCPGVDKAELRRWAKMVRSGLDIPELSGRMVAHLAEFLPERGLKHILLYSAFGSEPDPSGLQELYPGVYYLPRVDGQGLHIHPLPCPLARHKYGFLEPLPEAPTANAGVLQAVLVPGLVFDRKGHRIGYGQGFYDRFLNRLPKVVSIGMVPQVLVVEGIPADAWDIAVQYLATETGVLRLAPHL